MRVFDIYTFNIAKTVKIKDTKAYLDGMLKDLGVSYGNVSFTIQNYMTSIDQVVEKYPELRKYRLFYEPYRAEVLTSMTSKWIQGELFADPKDWNAVFDVFSKIPRGMNVTGTVVLHQIDWYGVGTKAPAFGGNDYDRGRVMICDDYSVLSSGILFGRQYDDGTKSNRVELIVETTTQGVPRDTQDMVDRVEPYLGKPTEYLRRCMFDEEELLKYQTCRNEAVKALEGIIKKRYADDSREYVKRMGDAFVPALVDKKMIKKSFEKYGFLMDNGKGSMPGLNQVIGVDRHNYRYRIAIDRTQNCPTFFYFYVYIEGCNFQIRNSQDVIVADSKEEAAKRLDELAAFCRDLQEEFGDRLSEWFGDTPDWYFEKQ